MTGTWKEWEDLKYHSVPESRKVLKESQKYVQKTAQFSPVAQLCPTFCDPMDCSFVRLPCPSPTPRVYSNSCLTSQWCHPTISSSIIPFSSHLQSFLASGSFLVESVLRIRWPMCFGVSASASVLPMYIQDWFPIGWTGWIFLQSKGFLDSWSFHKLESLFT